MKNYIQTKLKKESKQNINLKNLNQLMNNMNNIIKS